MFGTPDIVFSFGSGLLSLPSVVTSGESRAFGYSFLQENGFHVLRFLCEDVGKRRDEVLDAILGRCRTEHGSIAARSSQNGTIRSNYDGRYSDER
jgi:hypothetical protein